MERVLSCAVDLLLSAEEKGTRTLSILQSTKLLRNQGLLSKEQANAISTITNMCNKAVHGANVTVSEAMAILDLAVRLNKSFPFGYSLNFFPNVGYKEQGLLCEWEHCIELMHLTEEPTAQTCPVFGHDCPGGTVARVDCKKSAKEIPPERFKVNKPR